VELARDPITGLWYRPHTWDLDSIRRDHDVARCIEPGDHVLDLGAHIGASARVAVMHGAANVLAVEPHPDTFDILMRNLEANVPIPFEAEVKSWGGLGSRVMAVEAAVAHSVLYENPRSQIGHTTMQKPWTAKARAIPVIAYTLTALQDEYFAPGQPRVILCDIEGAEYEVDWQRELRACVQVLFMEFHYRFMPAWHAKAVELERLFTQEMGFVGSDPVPPLGMAHNSTHVFRRLG